MQVQFRRIQLLKRYPLTISRGTQAISENLFVTLQRAEGGPTGIGELAPSTGSVWDCDRGESQIRAFVEDNPPTSVWDNDRLMRDAQLDPPAMAALDVALWDLLAKEAGLPLHKLLGFPKCSVPTSVTAGLNPPEITKQRVPEILSRTGARILKVKLGSPQGIEADQDHFAACMESAASFGVELRVDANGGWNVNTAHQMMRWLVERGVAYVEQPLQEGNEAELPDLFKAGILPIFVDESVKTSYDVPKLADRVHGINLKLMKSGGITEALRVVSTARAHGLKTMIGCMSESSVSIAAGASIGALFDHIDLDSHLNLLPDPATGAPIVHGVISTREIPGHGASLKE